MIVIFFVFLPGCVYVIIPVSFVFSSDDIAEVPVWGIRAGVAAWHALLWNDVHIQQFCAVVLFCGYYSPYRHWLLAVWQLLLNRLVTTKSVILQTTHWLCDSVTLMCHKHPVTIVSSLKCLSHGYHGNNILWFLQHTYSVTLISDISFCFWPEELSHSTHTT